MDSGNTSYFIDYVRHGTPRDEISISNSWFEKPKSRMFVKLK